MVDYRTMRRTIGLGDIRNFSDITSNPDTQKRLAKAYNNDINKIDPFTATLCEDPIARDAVLGKLAADIVAKTFKNIRDGHDLWYEAKLGK